MHILALTPIDVDDSELARRQARYDRLSPDDVSVELRNIGSSAPRALGSAADIEESEQAVIRAFRETDPERFDAFLPDCVLDPGSDVAHSFSRPWFGLAQLTAKVLTAPHTPIVAVARNAAIAAELDRRLGQYGADADPTRVLGLDLETIADDEAWERAVREQITDRREGFVINACSAVDVRNASSGPVVVDPTATALRLLALRATVAHGADPREGCDSS